MSSVVEEIKARVELMQETRRSIDRRRLTEYRRANPDKVRAQRDRANARERERYDPAERRVNWVERYGITPEEYDRMLSDQGGVCAICHGRTNHPRFSRLFIDHCHTTGRVRGLLCNTCNAGIGHFKDDPARLLSAVAYLKRYANA